MQLPDCDGLAPCKCLCGLLKCGVLQLGPVRPHASLVKVTCCRVLSSVLVACLLLCWCGWCCHDDAAAWGCLACQQRQQGVASLPLQVACRCRQDGCVCHRHGWWVDRPLPKHVHACVDTGTALGLQQACVFCAEVGWVRCLGGMNWGRLLFGGGDPGRPEKANRTGMVDWQQKLLKHWVCSTGSAASPATCAKAAASIPCDGKCAAAAGVNVLQVSRPHL